MVEIITPNILVSVCGEAKTGKSHFLATFPPPIVIFSFDMGLDPILAKFAGKDIRVKTYPMPIVDSVKALGQQKELKAIWDTYADDYRAVTEDPDIKTIGIDTWSAVYELIRPARAYELGAANLLQFQYGEIYARLRSQMQMARISGQNLVLTSYLRDKFVNDQNTGEKEMKGWSETSAQADVVIWTGKKRKLVQGGKNRTIMTGEIRDNRFDPDLEGHIMDMPTYDDLAILLGL